ncbi:MAG: DUF1648 domain-containing protein [Saprospiraceae bacterium]|nr:DUF1648 domain-containing protein [Saprospiraceae bacterium]
MTRPEVHLEPDHLDKRLQWLALAGLVVAIVLPVYHYGDLPETIPVHFGVTGEADGFGPRWIIWLLPAIGLAIYAGLSRLVRHPHSFNYPVPITEKNAGAQYRNAVRMIRILNALITCSFAWITWGIIQVATGSAGGLGMYSVLIFLLLVTGTTGYFLYRAFQIGR